MLETKWTELVGCRLPIQAAPLPFHDAPDLAVAVAQAGGLAMVGLPMHPPPVVEQVLDTMTAPGEGVFGVNFLIPFLDQECLRVAARKARVVEFFYGDPDPGLVDLAHAGGALSAWQVGSRDEALAAERAGCDFVVAQGVEAGGHVRGRIGLLPLLAQVLDAVRCPVVAAGGIGTPRQLAAVLAAGAGGARLGTRLLAAREADIHPEYQRRLLAARAEDTVLTEAFSAMWPDAPHRVLRECIEKASALTAATAGTFATPEGPIDVPRFGVMSPNRTATGAIDAMALYAGESVGAIEKIEPAAAILESLVGGAAALLRQPTG